MKCGAYELARHITGKLRIGIQRDYVADAQEKRVIRCRSIQACEAGVAGASQQAVEFLQFAAFSLPTHPFVFTSIPLAAPVK